MIRGGAGILILGAFLLLVSCGTPGRTPPRIADPIRRGALEVAVRPLAERVSVLADTLEVDLSAELWDRVSHPAGSPFHSMSRRVVPPGTVVEYVFRNVKGGMNLPLRFGIGNAAFTILHSALFRLHRRGPVRLHLVAKGNAALVRKGSVEEGEVVELREGLWRKSDR